MISSAKQKEIFPPRFDAGEHFLAKETEPSQRLGIALFLHINIGFEADCGYAEAFDEQIPDLIEDYRLMLDALLQNPHARIFLEASGTTLLFFERFYPDIIERLKLLKEKNISIPVLGTYSNPLAPTTRPDHMALQLTKAHDIFQRIYQLSEAPEEGLALYLQEYFYTPHIISMLDALNIRVFLGWDEHVARDLPAEKKQDCLDTELVHPRPILNTKGPTFIAPISGRWIHGMRLDSDANPEDASHYTSKLESLAKSVQPYPLQDEPIFITAPGDAEYCGRHTPLGDGMTITPEYLIDLMERINTSPFLYFHQNPMRAIISSENDWVSLKEGGSRENLDVWTKDPRCIYLDERCDEAEWYLDEVRGLLHQIAEPELVLLAGKLFDLALEAYQLSKTSDARGFNPIQSRRDAALTHAFESISISKSLLKIMTPESAQKI